MALAVISSAFMACQKEQPSAEQSTPLVEAKPFYVTVDNKLAVSDPDAAPQSKATFEDGKGMSWEDGDESLFRMVVGTSATEGKVVYAKSMSIDESTGAATFTFEEAPASSSNVSFFYGVKDYGDLNYCFEGDQKQSTLGKLDKGNLFLKAVNVTVDGTSASPKMQLVGNTRRFLIYSSTGKYVGEKVASIKMTSSVDWRTLAGQISYNYLGQPVKSLNNDVPTYGDVAEIETVIRYNKSYVQVSVDDASRSAVSATEKAATKGKGIYMAVPPQTETDRVRYVITTDKAEYILESDRLSFENGQVTNLFVDLESKFVARKEAGSTLVEVNYNGYFPNAAIDAGSVTGYTLGWCEAKIGGAKVEVNDGNKFYGESVVAFEYKDEDGKKADWITCRHKVSTENNVATDEVLYDCKENTTGSPRTAIVTAIYKPEGYLAIPAAVSVKVTQSAQTETTPQP